MHEIGLLEEWTNKFNPVSRECSLKKKKKKNGNPQISLKNLTSAFILLIFVICPRGGPQVNFSRTSKDNFGTSFNLAKSTLPEEIGPKPTGSFPIKSFKLVGVR